MGQRNKYVISKFIRVVITINYKQNKTKQTKKSHLGKIDTLCYTNVTEIWTYNEVLLIGFTLCFQKSLTKLLDPLLLLKVYYFLQQCEFCPEFPTCI